MLKIGNVIKSFSVLCFLVLIIAPYAAAQQQCGWAERFYPGLEYTPGSAPSVPPTLQTVPPRTVLCGSARESQGVTAFFVTELTPLEIREFYYPKLKNLSDCTYMSDLEMDPSTDPSKTVYIGVTCEDNEGHVGGVTMSENSNRVLMMWHKRY